MTKRLLQTVKVVHIMLIVMGSMKISVRLPANLYTNFRIRKSDFFTDFFWLLHWDLTVLHPHWVQWIHKVFLWHFYRFVWFLYDWFYSYCWWLLWYHQWWPSASSKTWKRKSKRIQRFEQSSKHIRIGWSKPANIQMEFSNRMATLAIEKRISFTKILFFCSANNQSCANHIGNGRGIKLIMPFGNIVAGKVNRIKKKWRRLVHFSARSLTSSKIAFDFGHLPPGKIRQNVWK